MNFVEVLLHILKFSAIAVGAASGLVGILRQTREKGSERLTRSGRVLVALLMVSGIVALASQSAETYIKREADREHEAHRQRQIEDLQNLLNQASRQLMPLYPFDVKLNISYPRDYKGFRTYFEWLAKRHSRPNTLLLAIPVERGSADSPDPQRDSMETQAEILLDPWIEFALFRKGNLDWSQPDLVLMGGPNLKRKELWLGPLGGVGIENMASSHNYRSNASFTLPMLDSESDVVSSLFLRNPLVEHDNGAIVSFLDLDGATLIVDITNSRHAHGKLDFIEFIFRTGRKSGNQLKLTSEDLVRWNGYSDDKEERTVYRVKLKAGSSGVRRWE